MKTIALKTLAVLAFALSASASSGCIIVDDDGDSTLTIVNDSDFVLTEIRVARTDVNEPYGPNLIPADLFPGEEIVIGLDCDFYDVQIVDELGAVCELIDFDLCFDDAIWFVTNSQLAACDGFAQRIEELKKEKEAAAGQSTESAASEASAQ
jgi:hypothetical protein